MNEFVAEPPFFAPERAGQYFRKENVPWLLCRGGIAGLALEDADVMRTWAEKQAQFIRWAKDAAMFNEVEVSQNYALYNDWFAAEPVRRLRGRVLDIGGGWGLFREWWDGGDDGCFVVHDPGVERFTTLPPKALREIFANGLTKPAWFVEGFGEDLPYQSGVYDTVAVISALDHCAQPNRVLAEAARVLRSGGRLFIIQGFEVSSVESARRRRFVSRLLEVCSNPQRLYRAIRQRLVHRGDPHMRHFTLDELQYMLAEAGFIAASQTIVSHRFGVAVIEARNR